MRLFCAFWILIMIASAGCVGEHEKYLRVENKSGLGFRVKLDGRLIGEYPDDVAKDAIESVYNVELDVPEDQTEGSAIVEVLTPDGWRPASVDEKRFRGNGPDRRTQIRKLVVTYSSPTVHLIVDNRRRGTHTLELGEMRFVLKEDRHHIIEVPVPQNKSTAGLSIDGRSIGKLGVGSGDRESVESIRDDTTYYLIDPSGERSYRLGSVVYAYASSPESEGSRYKQLRGAFVYRLPGYVMRPFKIAPSAQEASGHRRELVEITDNQLRN